MNNPTLYIAYTVKYKTVLVYINSSKNTQNMNSICVACILLLEKLYNFFVEKNKSFLRSEF